jgi:hypothetical protein
MEKHSPNIIKVICVEDVSQVGQMRSEHKILFTKQEGKRQF